MSGAAMNSNPLGTEKIGKLMMRFAIPSIISLVVNSLYNMVDQIFIGQGVGYLGNAATNVILPLTTFMMAIAVMIGDGAATFLVLLKILCLMPSNMEEYIICVFRFKSVTMK